MTGSCHPERSFGPSVASRWDSLTKWKKRNSFLEQGSLSNRPCFIRFYPFFTSLLCSTSILGPEPDGPRSLAQGGDPRTFTRQQLQAPGLLGTTAVVTPCNTHVRLRPRSETLSNGKPSWSGCFFPTRPQVETQKPDGVTFGNTRS